MSAEVETMFYVKEKPWHGLGERVEEALCSKEALQMAGLDWNVIPKKAYTKTEDGGFMVVPNTIINVRDSDERILGTVTDKYKIVQNVDAFEFTDAIIGNGEIDIKYETAGSLRSGRKVWMLAKMPKITLLGDDVEPYMVFTNTHDGSGSIRVAMTPIRVVCQNTLTLALAKASRTWSTKHMGDMESKMHEAQVSLGLARDYVNGMEEMAETLQQIKITDENFAEYLELAFPIPFGKDATERKVANAQFTRNNFMVMYKNIADLARFKHTGWYLYNAVADYLGHCGTLRNTETYKENRFMNFVDGDKTMELTQKFILNV